MRCYFDDIPDEVLPLIQHSMKAPSYKAIAIALLNNDFNFHSLGFSKNETNLSKSVFLLKKDTKQKNLF